MRSAITMITVVVAAGLPAIALRLTGTHTGIVSDTVVYGGAIVAAAFLLGWAAEAAEVDIPQGLAVVFIAFVAVLPEYAVDITFAWKAGQDPEFAQFAVANMTGANRLLIGVGWSSVFLIFWLRTRGRILHLRESNALDVVALGAVTLYAFTLPLKGSITLFDTLVLFSIFAVYLYGVSRYKGEEPELVGPARWLGELPKTQRRLTVVAIFVYSAAAILVAAEPFAGGLIESGTELGIDEFLLVQWVAPLASETPEFLIAGIFAFRGRAMVGMAALLSSLINQWTLLVGALPVAFALSSGTLDGLPFDTRQRDEVLLTAVLSLFAVAVLVSLRLGQGEAILLFALFMFQFLIPIREVRLAISMFYFILSLAVFWRKRSFLVSVLRGAYAALRTPVRAGSRGPP